MSKRLSREVRPAGGGFSGNGGTRMRVPDNSATATLAYEEVKKRITDLRYPPGTKLSEVQLVEELGCGRSPIRTAFARLQNDGWVLISPQSGTYVKRLSEAEIKEIYDLRLLLEIHATRLAAQNMTSEELRKLRTAFRRLAPQPGDKFSEAMFDDINELDAMFHAAVYRSSGNSLITAILLDLLEKVQWLKTASPSPPNRMKQWCAELGSVLDALERRDPDAAATLMFEHIGHAADSGFEYRRLHAARGNEARPSRAADRTPKRNPPASRGRSASSTQRKASR